MTAHGPKTGENPLSQRQEKTKTNKLKRKVTIPSTNEALSRGLIEQEPMEQGATIKDMSGL